MGDQAHRDDTGNDEPTGAAVGNKPITPNFSLLKLAGSASHNAGARSGG